MPEGAIRGIAFAGGKRPLAGHRPRGRIYTAFAAILRDAASDLERFAGIVRVEINARAAALAERGGHVRPDFARRCNVLSLLLASFPVAVSTRLEHKIPLGDGLRTPISVPVQIGVVPGVHPAQAAVIDIQLDHVELAGNRCSRSRKFKVFQADAGAKVGRLPGCVVSNEAVK